MTLSPESDTADALIRWLVDWAARRVDLHLQDERRCLAPHVIVDLGRSGAFGIAIPKELGGLGFSTEDQLRVVEAYGAVDVSIAAFAGVNASIGVRPLVGFGQREVQEELLPLIASGRMLSAFALTEPGAGSNPDGLASQATRTESGWSLSGEKMWIGNGEWAGVYSVFARDLTDGRDAGVSGFVVRADNPGLRVGPEQLTLGIRATVQNRIFLEDARVPERDLLGEPGGGKEIMQATLMRSRLEVAAGAVGAMKRCITMMNRYASRRQVGTGRLIDNGLSRLRMNEALAKMCAVRALVFTLGRRLDAGRDVPAELYGLAKAAGSEILWETADRTVQLLGGRGYTENNHVSRILRDARILRIFEGPTETLLHFAGAVVRLRTFRRFIGESLNQPDLAEKFKADLATIREDQSTWEAVDRHLDLVCVGRLAMWLSLWAAAAMDQTVTPDLRDLVVHVASHHYSQALQQCRTDPKVLTGDRHLGEALATVCDFGDYDPPVVGVEEELDPLLRA